jgi:hypothetical protein
MAASRLSEMGEQGVEWPIHSSEFEAPSPGVSSFLSDSSRLGH